MTERVVPSREWIEALQRACAEYDKAADELADRVHEMIGPRAQEP